MTNTDGKLNDNYIDVNLEIPDELINKVVSKFYLFGKYNIQSEIIKINKKLTHVFFDIARNQRVVNKEGVKVLDLLQRTHTLLSDNLYAEPDLQRYHTAFAILLLKDVYMLAEINDLGELTQLILDTFKLYGDKEVN